MFDSDYSLTGKHAKHLKFLAAKNSDEANGANLFERYIDVYMNAVIWGLIYNRKEPKDNSTDDNANILAGVFIKERATCIFLYRLVTILDESQNVGIEEKLDKAFRDDEFNQNAELFNSYARGGIEEMYERFTFGCNSRVDYLHRTYEIMTNFKEKFLKSGKV